MINVNMSVKNVVRAQKIIIEDDDDEDDELLLRYG